MTCRLPRRGLEQGGVVKRRQAGNMGTSVFPHLLIALLAGSAPARCAENNSSASHSTEGGAEKLVLLNDIADVEAFISGAEVAVVGFFQEPESPEVSQLRLAAARIPEVPFALSSSPAVREHYGVTADTLSLFRRADKDRRDMDMDREEMDADKMSRFIRMNELRLVTEYNPMTAVGVMHSSLQLNLLLFTDKKSPEHLEQMRRYRAAAELFEGKILFILVDVNLKSNEQVMAYFRLKKSQLPALAIFHTPDEKNDVLPLDEVSIERVTDFCNAFLQKMQKEEDKPEEKAFNEEL
ncbi:endoplasmic reticulum resident protein 27 [Coturnix japonica]|uniref:endoplasmic reticulum resident protein 27 n=1 Tax=Coturnix japonica TaxID=93934 RepID=UPI0007774141|nr:endoplasmic reticulum resident protein 27 [Coturnix japonica]